MRTLTAGKFFERMASRRGIIGLKQEAQRSNVKVQTSLSINPQNSEDKKNWAREVMKNCLIFDELCVNLNKVLIQIAAATDVI